MTDRYHSLGGDGYSSPGRRSYQPSTDLIDRPTSLRDRGQRALFLLLSLLVLVIAAVCGFLFFPRPLTCLRSTTPPSIDCYTVRSNVTTWQFTHTVSLINPNYAPVTLSSALVFFTLVPPHSNSSSHSASRAAPPPPLPPACQRPVAMGSVVTSPSSSTVPALATMDVALVDRFTHTGAGGWDEVRVCLMRTCELWPSYDLDVDGLLRVSWLQVEGDVVLETVRVKVKCDHSGEDRKEVEEVIEEGAEEQREAQERSVGHRRAVPAS